MKKFSVLALAMLFVLGLATTAFASSYNVTTFTYNIDANGGMPLATGDTDNDNNVGNANFTGTGVGGQGANFNNVIKSDNMTWKNVADGVYKTGAVQRTHGEYQNNTNSCASCHQTHTAAAKDLLFKNSVYNTCTACHDGTLGFYNVFNASTAGTFGGTADGNASMHLASGAVQIWAAPGGNHDGDTNGSWSSNFACNSCHTPHGTYGNRLLHFDPNGMADTVASEGGQRIVTNFDAARTINNIGAAVADVTYVVYDSYANISALGAAGGSTGYTGPYATNNAFYNGTVSATAQGYNLLVVVKGVKNSTTGVTSWKIDTTPWFFEYEFDSNHKNRYYSIGFWKSDATNWANGQYPTLEDLYAKSGDVTKPDCIQTKDATSAIVPDPQNAFAYGNFTGIKSISLARVLVTKIPLVTAGTVSGFTYQKGDDTFYNSTSSYAGYGVNVSKFCAACHTDYFSNSGSATGMFGETAYRHNTTSDSYMCLRCHFAHGTDVTVMKDAKDRTLTQAATDLFGGDTDAAKAYMLDQNPSSALKRYTNMAVCWKCHTSSHSAGFKNTDYYKQFGYTNGTTTTKTNSVIPAGF